MTVGKELFAEFGNGKRDNIIFILGAGESVTCHFKASGTDTVTNKYFDLRFAAKKVSVIVNKVASITKINGVALKSPITLGTDAANAWKRGIEWLEITVKSDLDTTNFEVYAS